MFKRSFFKRIVHLFRHRVQTLWRNRKRLIYVGASVATLIALLLFWPIEVENYLTVDASAEIHDCTDQPLYVFLNKQQQWCFPQDLDQVNPWLVQATLAAEDRRFWEHHGIDPLAILRAVGQLIRHGRV